MDDETERQLQELPPDRRAKLEQAMAELSEARSARKRNAAKWLIGALGGMVLLFGGASYLASRGTAVPADGIPATARVDRLSDGFCLVGVKHSHCYNLRLMIYPRGGAAYTTQLDVNVPDRFSSRVQPGSYVAVVLDKANPNKVYLDVDAFAQPAPAPPPPATATVSNSIHLN